MPASPDQVFRRHSQYWSLNTKRCRKDKCLHLLMRWQDLSRAGGAHRTNQYTPSGAGDINIHIFGQDCPGQAALTALTHGTQEVGTQELQLIRPLVH
eukprot:1157878-Pelagomonas_calceolata.AAC.6